MAGLALLIGFPLISSITGCRNVAPGGVYDGDKALYNAELSINTSKDMLDTFVTWEKANREVLAAWPEIGQAAQYIRANAKDWFASAHAARDAYVANPTSENRSKLTKALAVLRTVLTEASGYMLKTATVTP